MRKKLLLASFCSFAILSATAQTKIKDGTGTPATALPAAGSLLELQSAQAGLRLPQVALTVTTAWLPLQGSPSAATSVGMFVYNTATANDVTPGIYYWDGTKWQRGNNSTANNNVYTAGVPTGTGTAGTIYTDTLAGSATQGQQYIWNGSTYVAYTSPAATEWNITNSTNDAGSNKTAAISRIGAIQVGSNAAPVSSPGTVNLTSVTVAQNVPGLLVVNGTSATTDKNMFMVPNVGATGYNPLSLAGDRALVWGPFNNSDGLVIGPWSTTANHGIRIASTGIISATGYTCRAGTGGAFSNVFNIFWNSSNAHLFIDATDLGAITTTSDRRLKENINALQNNGISRVMQLRPVSFRYKKVEGTIFGGSDIINEGFIADELQAVIPSAVNGKKDAVTSDGKVQPQTLSLAPIISVLTKAVQEQQAEIEAQKAINEKQQVIIEKLDARLKELEARK